MNSKGKELDIGVEELHVIGIAGGANVREANTEDWAQGTEMGSSK